MTQPFPHLRAAVARLPWAIMPDRLKVIVEVLERRCEGIRFSAAEIAAIKGAREPNGTLTMVAMDQSDERDASRAAAPGAQQQPTVIAVLSCFGIIAQHAADVDDISGPGGTSTERLGASFRAALGDPTVKAIVLNIDSPGGSVYGVQELADEIFKARGQKPIVAQVNSLAASAAYWIASACDEIVVTPSGQVGSIGVYGLHEDDSKLLGDLGIKFTFVFAGEYKVEGNPYEPLGDEARAAMQKLVDAYYDTFVKAVARGREVKATDVRNGMGQGRVVTAADAVQLGMADRVATLNETLRRLSAARQPAAPKADASFAAITLRKEGDDVVIVGIAPEHAAFTVDLITDPDQAAIRVEGDRVTLTAKNATVVYEKISADPAGNFWLCRLVSRTNTEPPAADHSADSDLRRRRLAHRSRAA